MADDRSNPDSERDSAAVTINGHQPRKLSPTERLRLQLAHTQVQLAKVTGERDQLAARIRAAESQTMLEEQHAAIMAAHGVTASTPWVCDITSGEFVPKGG